MPSSSLLSGPPPAGLSPVARAALRCLLLPCGPLFSIEGAERLARVEEPALFALNHSNTVESVLLPAVLIQLRGRPLHFLVDWMYLRIPGLGGLIRLSRPIPVYGKRARWGLWENHRREQRRRPIVEACLERLGYGGSLGIFPEGTRNRDPHRLLPGRPGLGELVLRSQVPVVPIGVHYPAARRLGRAPRLGRAVLRIGEPLDFAAERAVPFSDRAARRALGRQVVQRVLAVLAELSGKSSPLQKQELQPCVPVPSP